MSYLCYGSSTRFTNGVPRTGTIGCFFGSWIVLISPLCRHTNRERSWLIWLLAPDSIDSRCYRTRLAAELKQRRPVVANGKSFFLVIDILRFIRTGRDSLARFA